MKFRRKHVKTGIYSFSFKCYKCSEYVDCKLQVKILCFWVTIRRYSLSVEM